MTGFRGLAAMAALGLLVLAGCAGQKGTGPGAVSPGGASYAPDEVAIKVTHTGGFTTQLWIVTRLPLVAVYGDGRIVTPGAQITIYPAPALPSVQLQRIQASEVSKLVDAAAAAGVGSGIDYGEPRVTDMPSTVFQIRTPVGVKTTEVYALDETTGYGISDRQRQARAKLRDLISALTDPGKVGISATPAQPYQPKTLAAVVSPYAGGGEAGPQPEIAWPGPQLPGNQLNDNSELHCVSVTGPTMEQVLTAAQKANMLTPWKSGGKQWLVTLRPLLPHESGCDDLAKAA